MATDLEESIQELEAKLEQYHEQLEAVEAALETQPEADALLKLKSDLQEVITLTEDLIRFRNLNEETNQEKSLSAQSIGLEEARIYPESTVTPSSRRSQDAAGLLVGRTCQAMFEGKPYFAEILQVRRDAKMERVAVEFIGWKNREEYPLSHIKLLQPPPPALCVPGTTAQAIYSKDGKWYDCTINEQTRNGYVVAFLDYGNLEEVKFDQIRLSIGRRPKNQVEKSKEVVTPGGYRIPVNLFVKDSDSLQQRTIKKRKLQHIKRQQKDNIEHQQATARANVWRDFNKKAVHKKLSGYLTGRGDSSIFQSSEEILTNISNQQAGLGYARKTKPNPLPTTVAAPSGTFVPRRKYDSETVGEEV